MGKFFKSPSKYWAEDEEDEEAGDGFFGEESDDEDEDEDEEEDDEPDEDDILDAIRRGEYKPKKKDPWTWHVLYATSRDLESLNKNTDDFSGNRSKQKRR